jgi:hypothetical protein
MKKLNFKLFTISILLASTFATLTPAYAQDYVSHLESKRYIDREIKKLQSGEYQLNINIDILKTNEFALKRLEMAIKDLNTKVRNIGDEITMEITTNAPPGYSTNTPPGTVVTILPTYNITDTIPVGSTNFVLTSITPTVDPMVITPKFIALPMCITIVICIVIGGIVLYLVYRICKGVKTLISNYTRQIEPPEENVEVLSTEDGYVYAAEVSSAFIFVRTNQMFGSSLDVEQAAAPYMELRGYNPQYSFPTPNVSGWDFTNKLGFVIESKPTLTSPWEINCAVEFTPVGIYSFSNHSINITMPGDTKMITVTEPLAPSMFYRVRSVLVP